MSGVLLTKLVAVQESINKILGECITSISPESEEKERISLNEANRIKMWLIHATERINEASDLLYKENIIQRYNDSLIVALDDCVMCAMVEETITVEDLTVNPMFSVAVFSIKNLLEVIDDKIAEQDHNGIKGCLTSIAHELDNFEELSEVSKALCDVRDTFTDITMVCDMMYDFEKFYNSVFILHDKLNVGIALGSIKSVLPAPECGSGMEFF